MKTHEFPLIETERLLLTLPPPEDAARVIRYYEENREHLDPWSPDAPPDFYTEEYWRERLQKARADFQQGQSMMFFIFKRDEPHGRVVGICNFSGFIRGPFQACYLGYGIDYRDEGHGLMHEALVGAIKYAFDELRLHRIMANYVPTNERSGLLLRRLGFTVEGYARDYLVIAGQWRDHVLTSLTNAQVTPEEIRPR
jgi:ribosomal-protein-alanine N-acetyltransferase